MSEDMNANLDPHTLSQVVALSTGNITYVAGPLLCDPFNCPFSLRSESHRGQYLSTWYKLNNPTNMIKGSKTGRDHQEASKSKRYHERR